MAVSKRRIRGKVFKHVCMAVAALEAGHAYGADPALSAFGQSGGLVIPYGTLLAPGVSQYTFSNLKDPNYGKQAGNAQSYWAGIGLFPYVEFSGGLVNYASDSGKPQLPGGEVFQFRHLDANIKIGIPKFFQYQPDIAIGTTDYGGQTKFFRSRYIVASQGLGPLLFTLGGGDGPQRLNGIFGGVQLDVFHTGLSVLAEDDSKVAYVGLRYMSPPVPWLANASVYGTVQRALNSKIDQNTVNRTSITVGLQIPFGSRFTSSGTGADPLPPAANPPPQPYPAAMISAPVPVKVVATAPAGAGMGAYAARGTQASAAPAASNYAATNSFTANRATPLAPLAPSASGMGAVAPSNAGMGDRMRLSTAPAIAPEVAPIYGSSNQPSLPDLSGRADQSMLAATDAGPSSAFIDAADQAPNPALIAERLPLIQQKLIDMGLENVRVGSYRNYLVIEYENHRYNQNEADALGIVFGIAARYAPNNFNRILAVMKKADMPLGQVSVDRASYARFLRDGSTDGSVRATLVMTTRPTYGSDDVQWVTPKEGPHGLTRIKITPATNYDIGTEYGKFDYALGANIQGFVPLWKGAEIYASLIEPLFKSHNVDNGRVFSDLQLGRGLANLDLSQILWAGDRFLNVGTVGKFGFHYTGIEDETTFFVPSRPDIVRLRIAYLHNNDHTVNDDPLSAEKNAVLTYRWVQPDWGMWIEGGVARYVGGDKGEIVNLVKWFDDVSITLDLRHSALASFAGISLGFPLTPRQGMKPGITSLSGSESFYANVETRIRGTNFLNTTGADNITFDYSTQQILLNEGRFSEEYFKTQLYRMRDAYRRYVPGQVIPAAPAQMTSN